MNQGPLQNSVRALSGPAPSALPKAPEPDTQSGLDKQPGSEAAQRTYKRAEQHTEHTLQGVSRNGQSSGARVPAQQPSALACKVVNESGKMNSAGGSAWARQRAPDTDATIPASKATTECARSERVTLQDSSQEASHAHSPSKQSTAAQQHPAAPNPAAKLMSASKTAATHPAASNPAMPTATPKPHLTGTQNTQASQINHSMNCAGSKETLHVSRPCMDAPPTVQSGLEDNNNASILHSGGPSCGATAAAACQLTDPREPRESAAGSDASTSSQPRLQLVSAGNSTER